MPIIYYLVFRTPPRLMTNPVTFSESSPEQAAPVEPYRPVKRIISIDKKSAEGVMALLSMANAR